ncbi:MAG: hypothetical protein H0X16_08030 [Chloroflexi bacterium]|nr:hypothetical protein [Chloroflexota bacterium]
MIEPHSAQLGESSETAKATFVVAPRLNVIGEVLFPFPLPFAWPFETDASGPLAG